MANTDLEFTDSGMNILKKKMGRPKKVVLTNYLSAIDPVMSNNKAPVAFVKPIDFNQEGISLLNKSFKTLEGKLEFALARITSLETSRKHHTQAINTLSSQVNKTQSALNAVAASIPQKR